MQDDNQVIRVAEVLICTKKMSNRQDASSVEIACTFADDVERMTIDNGRNCIPLLLHFHWHESRKSRQPVFENYESQLGSSWAIVQWFTNVRCKISSFIYVRLILCTLSFQEILKQC